MAAATAPTPALPFDVRAMHAVANALFVLVALGLAAAALWWLVRQPVFAIRAIRFEGELQHNSAATLRAQALPRISGNFFTLDLQRARTAFEDVPWVRRAVVQRVWPDRLRVKLLEHRAAALWQGEDGSEKLVDEQGEVFEANLGDVEDDGLPTLSGPEGSAARALGLWRRLAPVFAQGLQAELQSLAVSERGSWRAELDTGAVVELGRGDDAEVMARSERFVRTLGQLTQRYQRPLAYADLRHADGYALRLKGITTSDVPLPPGKAAAPAPRTKRN